MGNGGEERMKKTMKDIERSEMLNAFLEKASSSSKTK